MKMVVYHNDLNDYSVSHFTEKELNLFFSILFKARDQEENTFIIDFSELRELANADKNLPRLVSSLEKFTSLTQKKVTKDKISIFSIFYKFEIEILERRILVQISKDAQYLLNEILGNYTKFDLIDFVSLKSSYSKQAFKLFKQYNEVGNRQFFLDDFREILGVPETYTSTHFNERVLKPIISELPPYFPNFKLEKIKKGRKVHKLIFTWGKNHISSNDSTMKDVTGTGELDEIAKYMKSKYAGLGWGEMHEKEVLKHGYTLEDFKANIDKWRNAKPYEIGVDISSGTMKRAKKTSKEHGELPPKSLFEDQEKLKTLEKENQELRKQMNEVARALEELQAREKEMGIKTDITLTLEQFIINNTLTDEGRKMAYNFIEKYNLKDVK